MRAELKDRFFAKVLFPSLLLTITSLRSIFVTSIDIG